MSSDPIQDQKYMELAFQMAALAIGNSTPNPSVGAVIVYNNHIIGTGFTQKYGEAHAEIVAIEQARRKLKSPSLENCTLYVTLEPCCIHKNTPPCTQAIINASISRIVIAVLDPNPAVNGQGMQLLIDNNISTSKINAIPFLIYIFYTLGGFFHKIKYKTPRYIFKWAQTKKGYLAPQNQPSGMISNPISKKMVFFLRYLFHTTMTSPNTIIYDNPLLTVRPFKDLQPFLETNLPQKEYPFPLYQILKSILQSEYKCKYYIERNRIFLLPRIHKNIPYSKTFSSLTNSIKFCEQKITEVPQTIFITDNKELHKELQKKKISSYYLSSYINLPKLNSLLNQFTSNDILVEFGAEFLNKFYTEKMLQYCITFTTPKQTWHNREKETTGKTFPLASQISEFILQITSNLKKPLFYKASSDISQLYTLNEYTLLDIIPLEDNYMLSWVQTDILKQMIQYIN